MAYSIHQKTQNSEYNSYFTKRRYIKELNEHVLVKYGVVSSRMPIVQFAYNCEPCGLALEYPIYIDWTITAEAGAEPRDDETAGEFDERIFVGKTGIYEYEAGGKGGIYKFAVPLNVRFTGDFAIDNH